MKITYESEQATVIDEFLDQTSLNLIREQVECLKLKQLEYGDDKIYKLNCGTIYKSDKKYKYDKLVMAPIPFRNFMRAIHEYASEHRTDWSNFSLMMHAYTAGAELSWHRDSGMFSGAYTFYLHKHLLRLNLMFIKNIALMLNQWICILKRSKKYYQHLI